MLLVQPVLSNPILGEQGTSPKLGAYYIFSCVQLIREVEKLGWFFKDVYCNRTGVAVPVDIKHCVGEEIGPVEISVRCISEHPSTLQNRTITWLPMIITITL